MAKPNYHKIAIALMGKGKISAKSMLREIALSNPAAFVAAHRKLYPPSDLDAQIKNAVRLVDAVKAHRNKTGASLAESVTYCKNIRMG